jgi:hypothetical protein
MKRITKARLEDAARAVLAAIAAGECNPERMELQAFAYALLEVGNDELAREMMQLAGRTLSN